MDSIKSEDGELRRSGHLLEDRRAAAVPAERRACLPVRLFTADIRNDAFATAAGGARESLYSVQSPG